MDIDDQPIGIRQQEGRIVGNVVHFQHHASESALILRHPHLAQKAVVHVEGFTHQLGRELRVVDIEEDAIGRRDTSSFVLHFRIHIDGHAGVIGCGPVPHAGNQRQRTFDRRRRS